VIMERAAGALKGLVRRMGFAIMSQVSV